MLTKSHLLAFFSHFLVVFPVALKAIEKIENSKVPTEYNCLSEKCMQCCTHRIATGRNVKC